ncbi:hypothetical protein E8E13_003181 [Curvularia kusanoi]|uniref:Uncharacterized protein n=1 Tax=Curvularia kusanoi TaxID=90978 RepID=A0A9P4T5G8_CURKU|nr:hypothetical protein E8E13_003181 [Curvularia kusanoi]
MEAFYAMEEAKVSARRTVGLEIEQRIDELNNKIDKCTGSLAEVFEAMKECQSTLSCANVARAISNRKEDEGTYEEMIEEFDFLELHELHALEMLLTIMKSSVQRNHLLKRLMGQIEKAKTLKETGKDADWSYFQVEHFMITHMRSSGMHSVAKLLSNYVRDSDKPQKTETKLKIKAGARPEGKIEAEEDEDMRD